VETASMAQRHRTDRVHFVEAQSPIVDLDHRDGRLAGSLNLATGMPSIFVIGGTPRD
jgi:hypothetical protein